jgi:hypothetical protein
MSEIDRRYLASRLPLHRRTLCRLEFHTGDWSYSAKGSCQQTRMCLCGQQQERLEHDWNDGWSGTGEVRTCSRCGTIESRGETRILYSFCEGLRDLGVEAKVVRSRAWKGAQMLGTIDIRRSPVSRVEIERVEDYEGVTYSTHYVVQHSEPVQPTAIRSVRVRTFPIFGRVVDVRWEGRDGATGPGEPLANDEDVNRAIISASAEITVVSRSDYWILVHPGAVAPTEQLWDCDEKVARRLLGKGAH